MAVLGADFTSRLDGLRPAGDERIGHTAAIRLTLPALEYCFSLSDPVGPPSALAPLSEISMISVFSYSPPSLRNLISSPVWWSVFGGQRIGTEERRPLAARAMGRIRSSPACNRGKP
jgi:hypothetical protein